LRKPTRKPVFFAAKAVLLVSSCTAKVFALHFLVHGRGFICNEAAGLVLDTELVSNRYTSLSPSKEASSPRASTVLLHREGLCAPFFVTAEALSAMKPPGRFLTPNW
jgi:hypothetical protein